jgi:AraC family transcriptional regulator of arabinose operon
MPTEPASREHRNLVTGHFHEKAAYRVDRPAGCHDWLIIYTLAGSGRFTCPGGTMLTRAHDVVLIEPQCAHGYGVNSDTKGWELLWAHFVPPPMWKPFMNWPMVGPERGGDQGSERGVMALSITGRDVRREILRSFGQAHELISGYRQHRESLALNALEAVLIRCDIQNPLSAKAGQAPMDPRIQRVLETICHHLHESLDVEQLARQCHLSPSRLAHLFKQQVGLSPGKFIERQRMTRAAQLLERTGHSVTEVGAHVGYGDPFYFSQRFRKWSGRSPRAYRRHFQSESKK